MNASRKAMLSTVAAACALVVFAPAPARAGEDWQPVNPAELAMKSDPAAPGAHAIILYRESRDDDEQSFQVTYIRIKVFTEEGKKYADIEIPYLKESFKVGDIKARTIRPDGTIIPFQGKVFEKTVVKGRGFRYLAKTFSFPDVQVGSIIEYRYRLTWDPYALYSTRWVLQENLFTKHAKFSLKPYGRMALRWINYGLPPGKIAKQGKGGVIELEMDDIPGFQEEDYIPPPDELKMRVDFFYSQSTETDLTKFWKDVSKKGAESVESWIGHRRGVEQAAAQIVTPDDPPETKLRKLYARVQQIRNLSDEPSKTEKEEKREKIKDNQNPEDVLRRGYASGGQMNWTFIALARAAGFEAYSLSGVSRNYRFFNPRSLDPRMFNCNLVLVKAGGKEYVLDPATSHGPFGLLPWEETDIDALVISKDEGKFIRTPLPSISDAVIERKADLKMDAEGKISGMLNVVFGGIEALRRRRENQNEDDASRKKTMEDEAKEWLPAGSTVELTKVPDWSGSDPDLRASFKVEISNWGTTAGRRYLMPLALLAGSKRRQFDSASRVHPVYFAYPFETRDEISIQLPLLLQVGSAPPPKKIETNYAAYEIHCDRQPTGLKLNRRLAMKGIFFQVDAYPYLRSFFQAVRSGDDQQVVLQTTGSSTKN
jgi:hypothetical protein